MGLWPELTGVFCRIDSRIDRRLTSFVRTARVADRLDATDATGSTNNRPECKCTEYSSRRASEKFLMRRLEPLRAKHVGNFCLSAAPSCNCAGGCCTARIHTDIYIDPVITQLAPQSRFFPSTCCWHVALCIHMYII